MLRRLLLLFCAACLVVGVGAIVGGLAQTNGCLSPSPSGSPTVAPPSQTPTPTPSASPSPCPSVSPTVSPTASPSPAPDTTPPTCKVTGVIAGPPKQMVVTVQDLQSGVYSFSNIQITNGSIAIEPYTPGTTGPVRITATKTDPSMPTVWSFDVTDVAGNTRHCT